MAEKVVLVEGWRFVPHSYAIVNQWQCLSLLERAGVRLFMRDMPLFNAQWKRLNGLFPAGLEQKIAAIEPLPPGLEPDAVLRLTVPVRLGQAEKGRAYVLGTADFGWLPRVMIENHRSLRDAHAGTDSVLLAPSHWARWGLERAGADPARIRLVPHGVDCGMFRPAAPEERERLREARGWQDRFVFLNVSAMSRSKGIDLIMKAMARVVQKHDHVWLMLKGADKVYQSQEWLQRWWREKLTPGERAACQKRIQYVGDSLPFPALADLYRAADAYVSPYRSESFNLPALEAVASGLPLICTEGGPTDDFTTSDFAWRIESKIIPKGTREPEEVIREPDLDQLTEAMFQAVENAEWRDTARTAGPAFAAGRFTWDHAVDQLLTVIGAEQ